MEQGEWITRRVRAGGLTIALRVPQDPDWWLLNCPESDDAYWAKLWPAGETFAELLIERQLLLRSHVVLELGCGCGLVGIALALAGYHVIASDYAKQAIEATLANAQLNGLHTDYGAEEVAAAEYKMPLEPTQIVEGSGSHRCCLLDWAVPPASRFKTIVGSDLTYDVTKHEMLLDFLKHTLQTNGTVWLADPGRATLDRFLALASTRGWQFQLFNAAGAIVSQPETNVFTAVKMTR